MLVENNRPGVDAAAGSGLGLVRAAQARRSSTARSRPSARSGRAARRAASTSPSRRAAGVMSVTGEPDGAPVKCGVPLVGFRRRPVRGFLHRLPARAGARRADRAATSTCRCSPPPSPSPRCRPASTSAPAATRASSARRTRATRPTRPTARADGWFAIAAGNNKLWQQVCEARRHARAGCDDPRFATTDAARREPGRAEGAAGGALRARQALPPGSTGSAPAGRAVRAHQRLRRGARRSAGGAPGAGAAGHAARRARHAHRGLPGAARRRGGAGRHATFPALGEHTDGTAQHETKETEMTQRHRPHRTAARVRAGHDETRGPHRRRGGAARGNPAAAREADRRRHVAAGGLRASRIRSSTASTCCTAIRWSASRW